MYQKFAHLGFLLPKEKLRKVIGGCAAAAICYDNYFYSYPGCMTSMEHFRNTGIIMNDNCESSIRNFFFNCWDDMCNEQPY